MKCTCGECKACYQRERQRQIKLGTWKPRPYGRVKPIAPGGEPGPKAIKSRIKYRRVGPEFLEIIDMTELGLDINTEKVGKTIRILISVKRKRENYVKMAIRSIREVRTEIPAPQNQG